MGDAFVLGAGFSRAMSDHMPTLAMLGPQLLAQLRDDVGERAVASLRGEDFESWLSYLASEQPWLTEAENLRNRATFIVAAGHLRELVQTAEGGARHLSPPSWLGPLVKRWHRDESTITTLNYDTLVEAAYMNAVEMRSRQTDGNWVHYSQLYPIPITPGAARYGAVLGSSDGPTFKLLKLHGSTSWYYSGNLSSHGEPIYDGGVEPWGTPRTRWARYPTALPDKVPLMVPPTAIKSGYFNNETVRGQWQLARHGLERADRIICIGYSLPPSDQLMASLLQAAAVDKTVEVVDLCTSVGDRFRKLLPDSVVTQHHSGDSAVTDFVSSYVEPALFADEPMVGYIDNV